MDSANRTFITMVIMTLVFFAYTTYLMFYRNNNEVIQNEIREEIKIEEKVSVNENLLEVIDPDFTSDIIYRYESSKLKIDFDRKNGTIINAWILDAAGNNNNIVEGNENNSALKIKLGSWNTGKTISELTNGNHVFNLNIKDNVFTFTIKMRDNVNNVNYTIEKKYTLIDDEYIFKLDLTIANDKNIPFKFDNSDNAFSIGWGPSIGVKSLQNNKRNDRYDIYGFLSAGKIVDMKENNKIFKQSKSKFAEIPKRVADSWIVANSHYNSAVIKPLDSGEYSYFFDYRKTGEDISFCGFSRKTSNSVIKSSFVVYIGPKLSNILSSYDNYSANGIFLENADFSKLDPKIMFGLGNLIGSLLKQINRIFNNYGLSIIFLTILIKLLLFPLTHSSMVSQQKMQTLQPKMKEIQAKYKDKPDMLNKKTMELYKKEGINPLSGCLPLLLQMPLLFAMYRLLDGMVELKGASFLWINDLAMPDQVFDFGFTIPLLNSSSFNILPIIMVLSQIASSMLMPDTQGNKQAKMMMWMMPLMFFFFFYNVASALVLYWTVMNILGIFQQAYIKYKGTHAVSVKK